MNTNKRGRSFSRGKSMQTLQAEAHYYLLRGEWSDDYTLDVLRKYPGFNVNCGDPPLFTLLFMQSEAPSFALVDKLLERGANVRHVDDDGRAFASLLVGRGRFDTLVYLVKKGALDPRMIATPDGIPTHVFALQKGCPYELLMQMTTPAELLEDAVRSVDSLTGLMRLIVELGAPLVLFTAARLKRHTLVGALIREYPKQCRAISEFCGDTCATQTLEEVWEDVYPYEELCILCQLREPSLTYRPCWHNCVCTECDDAERIRVCPLLRCQSAIFSKTPLLLLQ